MSTAVKRAAVVSGANSRWLCLAGLAALLAMGVARAAPPRPAPTTAVNLAVPTLGVRVNASPLQGGWVVAGFLPGGPVPLGDGSTLDVGDVIQRIGLNPALSAGKTPNTLINAAYNQQAPFIQVLDVNSGSSVSLPLP